MSNQNELNPRTPEWYRQNPIYYEAPLDKPPDQLIEEIRRQLSRLRGQLGDISRAYSGFSDRLEVSEGTLTCCISYLYGIRNEMAEIKLGENREPSLPTTGPETPR